MRSITIKVMNSKQNIESLEEILHDKDVTLMVDGDNYLISFNIESDKDLFGCQFDCMLLLCDWSIQGDLIPTGE